MSLSHSQPMNASRTRSSHAYILTSSRHALAPARSLMGITGGVLADALARRFDSISDAETGQCRAWCERDGNTGSALPDDDSVYRLRPVDCECPGAAPETGDPLIVVPAANGTVAKNRRPMIEEWNGPVWWVLHFDVQVRIGRVYRNLRHAEIVETAPVLSPNLNGPRYHIVGAPVTKPGECFRYLWNVGRQADGSPLPGWWGQFQAQCMSEYGLASDYASAA